MAIARWWWTPPTMEAGGRTATSGNVEVVGGNRSYPGSGGGGIWLLCFAIKLAILSRIHGENGPHPSSARKTMSAAIYISLTSSDCPTKTHQFKFESLINFAISKLVISGEENDVCSKG